MFELQVPGEKGPAAIFPVSHDEVVCEHYHADPLVYHGCMRTRFTYEIFQAMARATAQGEAFNIPYLCLHGSEDRMCLPSGSEEWHAKTCSADKAHMVIDGAYHELHNEVPEYRAQWIEAVTAWIDKHKTPPSLPSIM